jgi:hypothetical protein
MIATLVRRDPALRTLTTRATAVILVGAGLLLNTMLLLATRAREAAGVKDTLFALPSEPGTTVFAIQLAMAWLLLTAFLLLARVLQRCGPFELALPIPTRVVWRSRLIGQVLGGTILLALLGVVVALANWGMAASSLQTTFIGWPAATTHVAHLIAGLCLASVLVGSFDLDLSRLPGNRRILVALAGALLGTLAIMITLSRFGPASALLTLALALLLARRTESRLPASFVVAPRITATRGDAAPGRAASSSAAPTPPAVWNDAPSSPWSARLLVARVVWRGLYGHTLGYLMLGIIALYAYFLAGGAMTLGDEANDTGAVWIPLMWYLLLAFLAKFMKKLYVVDALPISRRTLFAALTLPGLAALLVGYGTAKTVLERQRPVEPPVSLSMEEGHPDLRTSLEYFRIDWDGAPPPLTSPWGENHEAKTVPFFRNSGGVLYKPYTTPPGSSPEFVALQLSRALDDIYGRGLTADQVRERYLVVDSTGGPALRAEGIPLTEDLARWRPQRRGRVFPVLFALTAVPWLLMVAGLMRAYRAGLSATRQKIMVLAVMGVALMAETGLLLLGVIDLLDLWTYSCVIKSLGYQLSADLPGGVVTAWILSALLVLGVYRFAESRFKKVEAMPEVKGSCLWS